MTDLQTYRMEKHLESIHKLICQLITVRNYIKSLHEGKIQYRADAPEDINNIVLELLEDNQKNMQAALIELKGVELQITQRIKQNSRELGQSVFGNQL
ncbi:MAG: hypothetical protein K9L17_05305 [Clostridiales bacterium]|nr:hypothetical protein [Clostridiales bacterium]MCF8022088.1 hypothetical protein [Clostridiales bacterium]